MEENEIVLFKNNDGKDRSDIEWVDKFYDFLQSNRPFESSGLKLTKKKAFSVIYFLQEHLPVFPDTIEQCSECGRLYDSNICGHHSELTNKFYCSESCEPANLYEREQHSEKKRAKANNSK